MKRFNLKKKTMAIIVASVCSYLGGGADTALAESAKDIYLVSGSAGKANEYYVNNYYAVSSPSDSVYFDTNAEKIIEDGREILSLHDINLYIQGQMADNTPAWGYIDSDKDIRISRVNQLNNKTGTYGLTMSFDAPSITYSDSQFDGQPFSMLLGNTAGASSQNVTLRNLVFQGPYFDGTYGSSYHDFGSAYGYDISINAIGSPTSLVLTLDNITFHNRTNGDGSVRKKFNINVAAGEVQLGKVDLHFDAETDNLLEWVLFGTGLIQASGPVTITGLKTLNMYWNSGKIYFQDGFVDAAGTDVLFNSSARYIYAAAKGTVNAHSITIGAPNSAGASSFYIIPMKEGTGWAAYKGDLTLNGGTLVLSHDFDESQIHTWADLYAVQTDGFTLGATTTLNNSVVAVALKDMVVSKYGAALSTGDGLIAATTSGYDHDILSAGTNLEGSFAVVDGHWDYDNEQLAGDDSLSLQFADGNSSKTLNLAVNERLADVATAHITIDQQYRNEKSVGVHSKLTGITVDEGKYLPLAGNVGGAVTDAGTQYLTLQDGIGGLGGIRIDKGSESDYTGYYLGGLNTYQGATVIGEGAQLHLESANAVMNSKDLIVEANGHLYLPESFDHEWDSVVFMGGIRNTPSTGSGGEETYTLIDGGNVPEGSAAPMLKVAGVGKHMSFFQSDNEQSDSRASTLSETDAGTDENSGSVPHHVVEVQNVNLSVLAGAAFWVNALEGRGTTTAGDQFTQEMAVLKLGSGSSLTIDGHADDSADAPTSSHMYLGNGIVQVQDGGTLTLGADSAIHFTSHMPGFFEWEGSAEDPHHHASVELASGSTLNVTLGEYNHIYSDKILEEGHEHFLIGTAWDERQSQTQANAEAKVSSEYFDGRAVNVQLTQAALDKIGNALATGDYGNPYVTEQHAQALSAFMQAADAQKINLTDGNLLSDLQDKLVGNGENQISEDQFHQALTAMLSMSMNNNRHAAWQDYLLTSEAGGIYMTVEDTKQWDEVTDIRLSLNKETNEVVQLEAHSTENADRLTDLAANSGAYQIISNAVNNYTMGTTTEESFRTAARIIDSAGQIATVGGAQTLAWDMLQTRRDSVSRHQDRLSGEELKNNLWVDVLYMNNKSHDMWNDLNGDREVKADLGGVIVGADAAVTDSLRVGAAFSWMDGSSETNLGMSEQTTTTNEVQGAAATFYGDYRFNDALRLKFDVGYQWGMNDLTMRFPMAMGIGEALKADVDTHTVQGNVTLEYGIDLAGGVSLVPFAGVGYTYLVTEGYTSTLGNKAAFRTESSKQQIVSVPVGVKLEGHLVNESTVFKPRLVAYVQPNFGDTEADNEVRGAGLTTVDRVNPEVIGEWSYGVSCGLAMELSDRVTFGFDYGFNGSNQSRNHSLTGSLRYAF